MNWYHVGGALCGVVTGVAIAVLLFMRDSADALSLTVFGHKDLIDDS